MIVVADTSPLNYLLLIDAIDILPKLFQEVVLPQIVLTELRHDHAPQQVQAWTRSLPSWIRVIDPRTLLPITGPLDAGEAAAISVAKQIAAVAVLIDERRGTKIARAEGLKTFSTLALLEAGAAMDFLVLETAVGALRRTNIRLSNDLIEAALQRDAERRRAQDEQ